MQLPEATNRMANSLKKQTQGDAMNIPPGIDRITIRDGSSRYRVRIRIKGHKPVSKNFKTRITCFSVRNSFYADSTKSASPITSREKDFNTNIRKSLHFHKRL